MAQRTNSHWTQPFKEGTIGEDNRCQLSLMRWLWRACVFSSTTLAFATLVSVMDGSGVGRGCSALMIHVIYQGRALDLASK